MTFDSFSLCTHTLIAHFINFSFRFVSIQIISFLFCTFQQCEWAMEQAWCDTHDLSKAASPNDSIARDLYGRFDLYASKTNYPAAVNENLCFLSHATVIKRCLWFFLQICLDMFASSFAFNKQMDVSTENDFYRVFVPWSTYYLVVACTIYNLLCGGANTINRNTE